MEDLESTKSKSCEGNQIPQENRQSLLDEALLAATSATLHAIIEIDEVAVNPALLAAPSATIDTINEIDKVVVNPALLAAPSATIDAINEIDEVVVNPALLAAPSATIDAINEIDEVAANPALLVAPSATIDAIKEIDVDDLIMNDRLLRLFSFDDEDEVAVNPALLAAPSVTIDVINEIDEVAVNPALLAAPSATIDAINEIDEVAVNSALIGVPSAIIDAIIEIDVDDLIMNDRWLELFSFDDEELDVSSNPSCQLSIPSSLSNRSTKSSRYCKCKTGCLKRYCKCFAAVEFCTEDCQCLGCSNREANTDTVSKVRQRAKLIDPNAFSPKTTKTDTSPERLVSGCKCKKSLCSNIYCECYKADVGCSNLCRCEGCNNNIGTKEAYATRKEQLLEPRV